MDATLGFDDIAQCSHYLIMWLGWALVVKRCLHFRSKPGIVGFGFCDRGER